MHFFAIIITTTAAAANDVRVLSIVWYAFFFIGKEKSVHILRRFFFQLAVYEINNADSGRAQNTHYWHYKCTRPILSVSEIIRLSKFFYALHRYHTYSVIYAIRAVRPLVRKKHNSSHVMHAPGRMNKSECTRAHF